MITGLPLSRWRTTGPMGGAFQRPSCVCIEHGLLALSHLMRRNFSTKQPRRKPAGSHAKNGWLCEPKMKSQRLVGMINKQQRRWSCIGGMPRPSRVSNEERGQDTQAGGFELRQQKQLKTKPWLFPLQDDLCVCEAPNPTTPVKRNAILGFSWRPYYGSRKLVRNGANYPGNLASGNRCSNGSKDGLRLIHSITYSSC